MPDLTTAEIEANIAALQSTYLSLAGQVASARSVEGRSHTLRELAAVRVELQEWRKELAKSTRADSTFTQGRPER